MIKKGINIQYLSILFLWISVSLFAQNDNHLKLNSLDYYEATGVNILVFSNWYDGLFSDSKISGVEIIHHGVRTATNGDVRLNPTPEQWDPIPNFVERKIDKKSNTIEAFLSYPEYEFNFSIKSEIKVNGLLLSVHLDEYLPNELKGRAGFNLEFLPSAYYGKSYLIDDNSGFFPLYPSGPMKINSSGETEPLPIASGSSIILSPEDPSSKIIISSDINELLLYDGRNKAQNGWFVLRSLIPPDKKGKVIEWLLDVNGVSEWIRTPQILYSQVGYHPEQNKIAIIEFDKNDKPLNSAKLMKINSKGISEQQFIDKIENYGSFLRYQYCKFDFSNITEPGIYIIQYDSIKSGPFKIGEDIYENAWKPTLDLFFPVQMDHMTVNEAYRIWHGASHLDDARQAPVNHVHFDLYSQGPTTDSPYKPGEHIPGLNIGGWFDAGDYDIRTQTHYYVIQNLVQVWERFKLLRDETLIDYESKFVDIHHPDGKPDLLQQIEHGTLALLAQHKSIGHAIPGIIVPSIEQYTHLGDAQTMTDNLIYDENLGLNESINGKSGKPDDRWAFTSKSTPLNYGSIAALAAASRALKGFNNKLSDECLAVALSVWDDEHSHDPDIFYHGNTTGGPLEGEELKAAVELFFSTKDEKYLKRVTEMWSTIESNFFVYGGLFSRVIPFLSESYENRFKDLTIMYKKNIIDKLKVDNPFGVPISRGGWAGNGRIIGFAINNYLLYQLYPNIISKEDIFSGLNYLFGCHPGSNISFVSGIGAHSKRVAYGTNRADFSFIAGGIVPGVLILKPDFPENKEDWPFFWGENEYVISVGSSYIFLVNAVNELLKENY